MCLSMRTRRSSDLQMRKNEWVEEPAVGRCFLYNLFDLFFRFFYYRPTKLHVLIHIFLSLFPAFFAIELLWDKGERRCAP